MLCTLICNVDISRGGTFTVSHICLNKNHCCYQFSILQVCGTVNTLSLDMSTLHIRVHRVNSYLCFQPSSLLMNSPGGPKCWQKCFVTATHPGIQIDSWLLASAWPNLTLTAMVTEECTNKQSNSLSLSLCQSLSWMIPNKIIGLLLF